MGDDIEQCAFCRHGRITVQAKSLAFHQRTDRGFVFCKVTIPMSNCDQCGNLGWDDVADAVIEEVVRREYEKLQ
jgi:hypothetical protein